MYEKEKRKDTYYNVLQNKIKKTAEKSNSNIQGKKLRERERERKRERERESDRDREKVRETERERERERERVLVWCKRLVSKQHYFEKLIPEAVLVVFLAL